MDIEHMTLYKYNFDSKVSNHLNRQFGVIYAIFDLEITKTASQVQYILRL